MVYRIIFSQQYALVLAYFSDGDVGSQLRFFSILSITETNASSSICIFTGFRRVAGTTQSRSRQHHPAAIDVRTMHLYIFDRGVGFYQPGSLFTVRPGICRSRSTILNGLCCSCSTQDPPPQFGRYPPSAAAAKPAEHPRRSNAVGCIIIHTEHMYTLD